MPDVPADTPSVTIVALRATKRIRRRDNGLLLPACKEYLSLQGGALGLHSPHDVLKVPNAAREPVDPRDHQHNAPLDVGSASDALTGYAAARSIRRSSIRLPVLNCAVSQAAVCLDPKFLMGDRDSGILEKLLGMAGVLSMARICRDYHG
jgi:hypothetical protein